MLRRAAATFRDSAACFDFATRLDENMRRSAAAFGRPLPGSRIAA
jgi:hypothetical protein